MPTRIISWYQQVREADPSFNRTSLQPVVYEFSNSRLFIDPLPLYGDYNTEPLWITGQGGEVVTDSGEPIAVT